MALIGTLQDSLGKLSRSLSRLPATPEHTATTADPSFTAFAPLALQKVLNLEDVGEAFEATYGRKAEVEIKLGGDLGGVLLANVVGKLAEQGLLRRESEVYLTLYWVKTVQEKVDEILPAPREEEASEAAQPVQKEAQGLTPGPSAEHPPTHNPPSPSPALESPPAVKLDPQRSLELGLRARKRVHSDDEALPSYEHGALVLAQFPGKSKKAWPSMVVDPIYAPAAPFGRRTKSSILVTWIPNGYEFTWIDPSKVQPLSPPTACDLLANKKHHPRNADDRQLYLTALAIVADEELMQGWKGEVEPWFEKGEGKGSEQREEGEAVVKKVGDGVMQCCSKPYLAGQVALQCDECGGWAHAQCVCYVCAECEDA